MKMTIIALEGLDKSGKHTQTELLVERLRAEGYKVEQSEFHRYDTPTGQLIQRWLYTRSGNMPEGMEPYDVDQKTIELIMAADKQAQQKWFEELDAAGTDVLILDRYVGSQYAYGLPANKAADQNLKYGEIHSWLQSLLRFVRTPDLTILIDLPPKESINRKGKHGGNDRYESDFNLLTDVRSMYYDHINTLVRGSSAMVMGQLPAEEIHKDIYKEAKRVLPPV
ncbi:dTMP kinase [Paenibacillus rhizovicinus]|nr:hypothetical protein [Paenibacillus rhizovicinus]